MALHWKTADSTAHNLARALEWVYFAVIFLALVTNGANAVLPLAVCVSLAGGLSIASVILLGIPERTRWLFATGICLFFAFSAWIGLQTLPAPDWLASPTWNNLSAFGIDASPSISMAPSEGLTGWLWVALPFLMFLAGIVIFRTDEQAVAAFRFVALGAGLLATICLVQFLITPKWLLFAEKRAFDDSYTFVFVNRNTAATCLGLIMLMLLVGVREQWRAMDQTRLIAWIMNGVALPKSMRFRSFSLHVFVLLVVVVSLAMTKSRAGIGAAAVAAALTLALLSWHGGSGNRRGNVRRRTLGQKIWQATTYVILVVIGVGLLASRAILRSEVQGTNDARFCITEGLLDAARDNWPTGGGFGAFTFIFSPYRDPACGIQSVWDKAHNSYLEGVITLGVFFIPLLFAGLWALARAYRIGLHERKNLIAYPIVGIGGLCLTMLHSAFDFSLQIPGMAAFYAAFAALPAIISVTRSRKATEGMAKISAIPAEGMIWGIALSGLALLSLVVAAIAAGNAVSLLGPRAFANALDAGETVDGAALRSVIDEELPADRLESCDGDIQRVSLTVLLADLDRIDRDKFYDLWALRLEQTEEQVRHALACMPGDSNLWLRLAMLKQAGGEIPAEQTSLMALSQQLNPSERRQLVGRLAHWNRLSSATLALSREDALADVRNGLNYLPVADIRLAIANPSPTISGIIQEALPLLSPERRTLLGKANFAWSNKQGRTAIRR